MQHASLCLSDVWAAQNNQSSLAFLKQSAGSFYCANHFGFSEFNTTALALVIPMEASAWSLCAVSSGNALYQSDKAGLAYARRFGNSFAAAAQLDFLSIRIGEGYGSRNTAAAELSFRIRIIPSLHFGAHLFNPTRTMLSVQPGEQIATVLRAGLLYECSRKIRIAFETEKDNFNPPLFRAGFEYQPAENIFIRAGACHPAFFSFGAGMQIRNLRMDFSSAWHPVLGYSPTLALTIFLGKKHT